MRPVRLPGGALATSHEVDQISSIEDVTTEQREN